MEGERKGARGEEGGITLAIWNWSVGAGEVLVAVEEVHVMHCLV